MPFSEQFKPFMKISGSIRLSGGARQFTGEAVSSPIVYYFVKDGEKILGFIRLNTNDEQTAGWIGTVNLPSVEIKDIALRGLV